MVFSRLSRPAPVGSRRMAFFLSLLLFAAGALSAGFVSCASTPASDQALAQALANDPAVSSGTLDNGLQWLVLPNGEPANRIYLRLAVRAGSVLEDDDQRGLAHLVEHMAFDGTKRFAKDELVSYFESIGMAFGPEVNAYTSFDETVYMLEIPADDPAILERSLAVLRDWAGAIAFDDAELERERGVVIEEWRLGRGASGRVRDRQIPFMFAGSAYADRLPIGDPEVVRSASRARILDFYRSWYRPELMSVVAVGAQESGVLSEAIARAFSDLPASENPRVRPVHGMPPARKPGVLVTRDGELQYVTAQILEPRPALRSTTRGDFRANLVKAIAFAAINKRLEEKTLLSDPAILAAEAGNMRVARPTEFTYLAAVSSPGRFRDAFDLIMTELARAEAFGVTEGELAREKADLLDLMRQTWLERDKAHSAGRAAGLLNSWLTGDPLPSIDDRYALYGELLPGITARDVSEEIGRWFADRGTHLMVSAPESATDVPDEAALAELWLGWKAPASLEPYAEEDLSRPLYPPVGRASPATVTAATATAATVTPANVSSAELSPAGIREWRLSNGARVVYFPTTFKANEIIFTAFSRGGTSLVLDADYPSASVATDYAQSSGLNGFTPTALGKKLAGKTVSCAPWIDESFEGLSGGSSVEDLETLFQLAHLHFVAPDWTASGWDSLMTGLRASAASRASNPDELFGDLKARLLWGDSPRYAPLTPGFVDKMEAARAEAAYRSRYADAGDFTFVFTGSLEEDRLKEFVLKYIATLPGTTRREEARPVRPAFPRGVTRDSIKAGIEQQSSVYLAFGGKTEIGEKDHELFGLFLMLLDIRLRESVREAVGGTYGISVNGGLLAYPEKRYQVDIEFGCAPGTEDALTAAVLAELASVRQKGADEKDLVKLRETFRRTYETGLKTNGFWHARITRAMTRSLPFTAIGDVEGVVSRITRETMRDLARRYVGGDNRVEARLLPAN